MLMFNPPSLVREAELNKSIRNSDKIVMMMMEENKRVYLKKHIKCMT